MIVEKSFWAEVTLGIRRYRASMIVPNIPMYATKSPPVNMYKRIAPREIIENITKSLIIDGNLLRAYTFVYVFRSFLTAESYLLWKTLRESVIKMVFIPDMNSW